MAERPQNLYDRAAFVDAAFVDLVSGWSRPTPARADRGAPVEPGTSLTGADVVELFESQILSRHVDLMSRALRAKDQAFYTIGSSGHESNAVLGRLTRATDPAFLHYRSGGFMFERSRNDPAVDSAYDTLLALVASSEDPIGGGRHKVWGSRAMWVLPQTSTIASHLPKAVGTAIALHRVSKLGLPTPLPHDSIVVCSFGDASLNHSTALGAFNAAARASYQQLPVPILLVCEDNGIGISVRTPQGWVHEAFSQRPGMRYFRADGLDLVDTHRVAEQAIRACRQQRRPVFLHLEVVRLLGHAGSDIELEYRPLAEVEADEAKDPLLRSARLVIERGWMTPADVLELYEETRRRVAQAADRAVLRPRLSTADEVLRPLAPHAPDAVTAEATRVDWIDRRAAAWGGADRVPELQPPKHLAAAINLALTDVMIQYPESLVFGEDVAEKGGVYHVTAGLKKRFGHSRVFNTILDEQTILGLAQGFAYMGLLPLPEIQYLAYFHNACDQIRGEACSMQFFSNAQYRNPMVLRIASLAYQKGFGGHFHNDNSVAALRDIPGLVVACPSRGDDAVGMLRTSIALARVDGRVVAFLEPIALYMTRDLHAPKDGQWVTAYPAPGSAVPFREPRVYDEGARDLAIVTYGNGVWLALRAARQLREQHGLDARIVDLRWLVPFDGDAVARHARDCGRLLVVDEGRATGGIAEGVITAVVERLDPVVPMRRVAGRDTYIPLGPAANLVLPSEREILEAAVVLCRGAGARA